MSEKGELVEQLGRRILGMWIIYRIISSTPLSFLSQAQFQQQKSTGGSSQGTQTQEQTPCRRKWGDWGKCGTNYHIRSIPFALKQKQYDWNRWGLPQF